jgi:NADP-dependent 3-hydroxy acid dehydrogenase YdfG
MKEHRSTTYQRVWFITGSSAGLGRALTEAVLARGERAVVTARTPQRVRDLIERFPAQALVLELDVTQQDQVRHAVSEAIDELAPLGIKVITIEPTSANGHQPGDSAAVAGDIIAAVDGDN